MVGAAVLLAGGFLLSALPQSAAAQDAVVGGFEDVSVTSNATDLLILALSDEANYAAGVADRVCVYNVTRLSEQVVAGTNYRFEIKGSAVANAEASGWCADADNSIAANFQVTVFEQTLTKAVEVTSILSLDPADDASSSGSGSDSWGYGDAGYSSSSYDSSSSTSSSTSSSGSGSGINVGDVGYVGDEDASASASGSIEFDAGSYSSSSSSGSADNDTISFAGL
jgi:hypothetical protein